MQSIDAGASTAWTRPIAVPRRDVAAFAARATRIVRLCAYVALLVQFSGLSLLYLQVPADLPQPPFWSPRPHHSAEVSALYRAAYGLPTLPLTADQFRAAHQVLLFGSLASAAALLALSRGGAGRDGIGRRPLGRRAIWAGGAVLATAALMMPPLYATDVFFYSVTGDVVARFGGSPYASTPSAFPESPSFPYSYWDIASPYGPVWTTVSASVATLGGFDPFRVTFLFKLLGAACIAGTGWLLQRHLGAQGSTFPLALLLLNPIVWIEAVANAHLDALMLWLVALTSLSSIASRPRLSWACLLLATWVKYLTAPLLGIHAVARLRRAPAGRRAYGLALAVMAFDTLALSALVWLPHWRGPATFAGLATETAAILSSPTSLAVLALTRHLGLPPETGTIILGQAIVVAACAWIGLGLGLLVWLWRRPAGPDVTDELYAWGLLLLALPFAVPQSHPWYLLVPMGLLLFAWKRSPRPALAAHLICAAWAVARYVPA